MRYTVDELWDMQIRDTMPNLHVDHIATVMNSGKRGIVERDFQKKLKEKRTVCKPYFAEKIVFVYNKKKDVMEKKKMVYVKNLTEFIMFVIGERKVDPHETESLIEIDGGGSSVKFTLIIRQKKERAGQHLSSGVRRALVVCAMFDGNEANPTLAIMIDIISLHECKCKFCNDLKVSIRLAGLMGGWPTWPCPYCFAHKNSLEVMGDLRTIWSLFEDFERYEQACIGLTSEKAKRDECKNHNSVQFKPLLAKNKESVLPTDLVLFKMPPDELHHLTGPFGKLYHCNRIVYPKIDQWSDELCDMKKYQGGTFVGNDCVKLLQNIDELDNMMRADHCVLGLLFIPAYRALNAVRKAIFGQHLEDGWEEKLDQLKETVTDLIDEDDVKMSCTLKFHVLFCEVRLWCQREKRGLGQVSTQTGESMHCRLENFLERFKGRELEGIIQWNSSCLGSVDEPLIDFDGDGD